MAEQPDIDEWTEALAGRRTLDDVRQQRNVEALARAVRAEDKEAWGRGAVDAVGLARMLVRLEPYGLVK